MEQYNQSMYCKLEQVRVESWFEERKRDNVMDVEREWDGEQNGLDQDSSR